MPVLDEYVSELHDKLQQAPMSLYLVSIKQSILHFRGVL